MTNINKVILTLVALLAMTTGAWAADTYTITAAYMTKSADVSTDATLPYETTLAACYQAASGSAPNAMIEVTGASITSGTNVTIGTINGWDTPLTISDAGESQIHIAANVTGSPLTDLDISITATKNPPAPIVVTPTANANEWTFLMPDYDVEVGVVYDTELALSEETDNTAALDEWDGYEADVTLTRTLQTGGWNTLAVPFSISAANYAALQTLLTALGGSIVVKQLSSSSFNEGALTLNFADATSIEAGKPYLVKVSKSFDLATLPAAIDAYAAAQGLTIVNPFKSVEVSKTAVPTVTDAVDFIPTLGLTEVTGDPKEILFIGGGNKMLHPTELPDNMKGFRAYFLLKGGAANASSFSLNFGDGETTGIQTIDFATPHSQGENGQLTMDNEVYDLQGRKIVHGTSSNGKLQKGLYIVNGKKVIIK